MKKILLIAALLITQNAFAEKEACGKITELKTETGGPHSVSYGQWVSNDQPSFKQLLDLDLVIQTAFTTGKDVCFPATVNPSSFVIRNSK